MGWFGGKVLGTLDQPVHAANLEGILANLDTEEGIVLGVDAVWGQRQR